MEVRYLKMAKAFKALSDPKRVKIVDMLACGEMCACMLLTQPTLAHDMKVLTDAELVVSQREGKRTIYSVNWNTLKKMNRVMADLVMQSPDLEQK